MPRAVLPLLPNLRCLALVIAVAGCTPDSAAELEPAAFATAPASIGRWHHAAGGAPISSMPMAAPIGASPAPWLQFCAEDGDRHRCGETPTRVRLTEARWAELTEIQGLVNQGVTQQPDAVTVGDQWTLLEPGGAGDCEDIALTKRDELMSRGWPAGALRPAFCYAYNQPVDGDEIHAVLTVETDAGTYVLGNLDDSVRTWADSECRDWIMRADDGGWRWIDGGVPVTLIPVSTP